MTSTLKATADTIAVSFGHDMDSSWYNAAFPNNKLDGTYDKAISIEKIAKTNGWKIQWFGDQYYNPWKDKVPA